VKKRPPTRRLLDYYRQFEALSPEENSARLIAKREEEKSKALSVTPVLDLSRPEWHEPPDPEIVNAATFALRRALNRYPDAEGGAAREAAAARHGLPVGQVALGHGAAQLLQAAVRELATGARVVLPWPTWSPLPAVISRSGATPVPVELDPAGLIDLAAIAEAARGEGVRAVVLCSPNDPTGSVVDRDALRRLAAEVGDHVALLVDEALVDFVGEDASLVGLVDELPGLLVFRSFSKAFALAGLRAGYAVGGPALEELLSRMTPGLGVHAPALAAIATALDSDQRAQRRMQQRRARAAAERERLERALQGTGYSMAPSRTPYVWLSHEELDGPAIARGLDEARIVVAPGMDWSDADHVRITLRDKPATERLASSLRALIDAEPSGA
jgi:histidinol-phosphate aminotransferase